MISLYDNIKSEDKLWERLCFYNLNSLYKKLKPFITDCFENKTYLCSDRDLFMKTNMDMPENIVYIPKDAMSSFGDVIVPCQITKGSLPSVQNSVHKQDEDSYYCSDISIQISMDSATTIAQFSQSVVGSNPDYEYGDQISLIFGQQFNENDIPHVQFSAIEITLDQSDSRLLSDKAKDNAYLTCFSLYNGYLSVKVDESVIPQNMTGISPVWIHSRDDVAGNILVSTQYLYDCNPYTDAHDTALESYGFEITKKKFLEPDEMMPAILTD